MGLTAGGSTERTGRVPAAVPSVETSVQLEAPAGFPAR